METGNPAGATLSFPGRDWIATRYHTSGMGYCIYNVVRALSAVWYEIAGITHLVLRRR